MFSRIDYAVVVILEGTASHLQALDVSTNHLDKIDRGACCLTKSCGLPGLLTKGPVCLTLKVLELK